MTKVLNLQQAAAEKIVPSVEEATKNPKFLESMCFKQRFFMFPFMCNLHAEKVGKRRLHIGGGIHRLLKGKGAAGFFGRALTFYVSTR